MKTVISIFKIIRPLNCLITFLSILVGGIICSDKNQVTIELIIAGFIGFIVTAAGNIINDYFDVEVDRINRPYRELAQGNISSQSVLILFLALSVSAFLLSLRFKFNISIIVLLTIFLLFLYSFKLKQISLVGNFTVSFLTGFAFIFAGVIVGNVNDSFIPAVFAFLINFNREIIKDAEDIEGDSKIGLKTFPIKFGIGASKYLILTVSVSLLLFTIVPFIFKIYRIEYFLIVMVFVNPILVYSIKSLFEDSSKKNIGKISRLLKACMFAGLFAIYFGK